MKITLLGTGTSQGVPVIGCNCNVCKSSDTRDRRLRSSILIEHKNTTVVIDAGPDFRYQMLRAGVTKLDGIVLTHEHRDHTAGLDDIRPFNKISNKPVDVYAEKRVLNKIKTDLDYAFKDSQYPGLPSINLNVINDNSEFRIGDISFIPLRVMHHRLPVLGFRTGNFAYITDVSFIPDDTFLKLNNIDLLVIDALRIQPHISHFNLNEAVEIIIKTKAKSGLLTHMSHQIGKHKDLMTILPGNISPGYDGMTILCK
ncbi:MAG: MBL fold metallo-hydrolase [Chlorobi bacterium]|nr:MBL fold metallo-hydrolase [Chlorobiota bacterium]